MLPTLKKYCFICYILFILDCDQTLGIMNERLPDTGISASSALDEEHFPPQSRLQLFELLSFKPMGWIPAFDDPSPWLQVSIIRIYSRSFHLRLSYKINLG